ncbi:MAG: hypothetical protein IBX62_06505 [Coriobacteriia bacterium]|nr:hypothetical protein [Coriobacteriia bacterium]
MSAGRAIGAAEDFYRLRIVRVDEGEEPQLEWREDVLYRRPAAEEPEQRVLYVVQAVSLDDDEACWSVGEFEDPREAHLFLDGAEEDLRGLTRSRFDERYGIAPSVEHPEAD